MDYKTRLVAALVKKLGNSHVVLTEGDMLAVEDGGVEVIHRLDGLHLVYHPDVMAVQGREP